MKISQLRHLKAAAEYGSMSRAADACYISQSTFSTSIGNLESELNAVLLDRSNKGVHLTKVGESVLAKAQDILSMIDDIHELSKLSSEHTAAISTIPCINDFILPRALTKLSTKNESLNLTIYTQESLQTVNDVINGSSCLGIIIHSPDLALKNLTYEKLLTDRYLVCVGQSSPLFDQSILTVDDFLTEPYIAYRKEFLEKNPGLSTMFRDQNKPNIALRSDDLSTIRKMIKYTDYIAFFPEKLSAHDDLIRDGFMRALPIEHFNFEFEVGFVENPQFKQHPIVHSFKKCIRESIQECINESDAHTGLNCGEL